MSRPLKCMTKICVSRAYILEGFERHLKICMGTHKRYVVTPDGKGGVCIIGGGSLSLLPHNAHIHVSTKRIASD